MKTEFRLQIFKEVIHMAGKKDNAVVAVIGDLTDEQAAQMTKEIMKAKRKNAPYGRGTIACCKKSEVGGLLQTGKRKQLERKE
jgi:predicted Zn-dependent peptidase